MGHTVSIWYVHIHSIVFNYNVTNPSSFTVRDHSQVTLEEWSFLESIFSKSKLEERTWAKLVTLDTLHWHYDGLEPIVATRCYDAQVHQRKFVTLYLGFFDCTLFYSNHLSYFCV